MIGLLSILTPCLALQLDTERYIQPPQRVAELVTAPWHQNVSLANVSPDGTRSLVARSAGMPTIADLSRPYLNLAGVSVDPAAFRDRGANIRKTLAYEVWTLDGGATVRIEVPEATVGSAEWSPDGRSILLLALYPNGTRLCVADAATGHVREVSRERISTAYGARPTWIDSNRIATVVVPNGRGPAPDRPAEPDQPIVRVTDPRRNSLRTYRSLLQDTYDQAQFEFFLTGQLAIFDLGGSMTPVGAPAMIRSFNVAPDGGAFRVTYTIKPFSYLVPASQFGWREELWDATGKVITELNKRDLTFEETTTDPPPVQPTTPARGGRGATGAQLAQARPEGRRSLAWRPDGVGMSFLQLEPAPERREGEQPATEGQRVRKDRVMQWLPPYGPRDTKVIYESETPIVSVRYSADCQLLFVNETRAGSDVLYAINLKERGKKYPLYTRSTTDPTNRPGTLVTRPSLTGVSAVHVSPDGRVFLTGTEGSRNPTETAPRPYLDQISIETGKSERIWQSAEDRYEQVQSVLDEGATLVLVRSESPTEVPNSYLVRLPSKEAKQLTDNKDYAPEVTQAEKHRLQITRQDGLKFWCEVVMPRFAVKGFRRPAIFWFYPREYRDQRGYDESQRNYNKNAFSQPGAMAPEYFVTQGYVVVKPDCPIIGAANAINDNYVSELRNNLAATIDELERQGFIDRSRLALGGHSYGAFSTVNAMVHTPFFKAGIAGHGNYNRTLTPFAFQSERRQLWEAKWVYQEMSPLFYAERLTGALLLYHGLDDQNVGTDPINSTNLFQALEALGKTAAVYMYPCEGHGPAARETLLDMWARWIAWLEKHVKATPEAATQSDAGPSDG